MVLYYDNLGLVKENHFYIFERPALSYVENSPLVNVRVLWAKPLNTFIRIAK